MARPRRALARIGNRTGVWMYRRLNGRLSSSRRNVRVLVLTVPGRRTSLPRSACVRYLDTPDGLLVWGTGSGSPRDPDWFENLRNARIAEVRLRDRTITARPRELTADERNTAWHEIVLAQAPQAARYARRARRVIPVALLEPL